MVLILQPGQRGPQKAPDFEELVKTLTDPQIAFLATVLRHAAEQDYGVLEEFYMWVANKFMDFSESQKDAAIPEAEGMFFTEKAFERYATEQANAERIGKETDDVNFH